MNEITLAIGSLICQVPVGIDLCLSSAGRSVVGTWGIVAIVALVAFFFLMRNPIGFERLTSRLEPLFKAACGKANRRTAHCEANSIARIPIDGVETT